MSDYEATPKKQSEPAKSTHSHGAAPKSTSSAHTDAKKQVAQEKAVMNPTYVDASALVERHFRREGEIAGLLDTAARNGFEAFKTRSSVEYNKSGSIAFALFEAALAAIPAAGALLSVFRELTSGAKAVAIVTKVAQLGGDARRAQNIIDKLHKAQKFTKELGEQSEEVKLVKEAAEKTMARHEATETRTEAQESGEFQIETLHSLTDLSAKNMQTRFSREDVVVFMLKMLETSDASNDLNKLVKETIGDLPKADGLDEAVSQVSDEFEIQLYIQWYVDSKKTTKTETYSNGHHISTDWDGMPIKVQQRFQALGKMGLLDSNPNVIHVRDEREHFAGNKV